MKKCTNLTYLENKENMQNKNKAPYLIFFQIKKSIGDISNKFTGKESIFGENKNYFFPLMYLQADEIFCFWEKLSMPS